MPLIVCDKCECIANTSGSTYWHRNLDIYGPEHDGKVLCEDCLPETYSNGNPTPNRGRVSDEPKTPVTVEAIVRSSAHFIYLGRFEQYRTRAYGDHK